MAGDNDRGHLATTLVWLTPYPGEARSACFGAEVTACEVTDANDARSPGFSWKPGCVSAALAIRQENLSCEANPISGEVLPERLEGATQNMFNMQCWGVPPRSHHCIADLSTPRQHGTRVRDSKGLLAKLLEMSEHGFRDAEAHRPPFLPPWRCARRI